MPDPVESLHTFYEQQCAGLQAEVARLMTALAASEAREARAVAALREINQVVGFTDGAVRAWNVVNRFLREHDAATAEGRKERA